MSQGKGQGLGEVKKEGCVTVSEARTGPKLEVVKKEGFVTRQVPSTL